MAVARAQPTPLALSTFDRPSFRVVSRNKVQLALSTCDPRIERLERLRAERKVSHFVLCAEAKLHPSTWLFLRRGDQDPRGDTLARLEGALARLTEGAASPAPPTNIIVAFVRLAEQAVRGEVAGRKRLIAALTPDRVRRGKLRKLPTAIEADRLRRIAIYLAAVEFEVGNAELARALGITRQAVHQARRAIFDLVDENAEVDALLERCRVVMKGEGR